MDPTTKVALLNAAIYAVQGAKSLIEDVDQDHQPLTWPAALALLNAAVDIVDLVRNSGLSPTPNGPIPAPPAPARPAQPARR